MLKRLFDIVASATALIIGGIPMLLIALAVRMTSPGAAIFCQRRVGWRGKPFTMLKFRTMRADVDPYGTSPHSAGDDRLTPLGRFLRETSLDELPQLRNILAGQMSLVGPRPLYERQAAEWNQRQRRRLEVRPGLTGYAQAYGRGAMGHEQKLEMDVYYVEHRGFLLDMKIILRTLVNLLPGRSRIYEQRYSAAKERETD
jgi:lipopolysaccharide/colanic/teichoic acid biosynthesis glycosyltransferase